MWAKKPERGTGGVTFVGPDGDYVLPYSELFVLARQRAKALHAEGFKPGDFAVLLLTKAKEFLIQFHACLIAGVIPVPLSADESEVAIERVRNVYRQLNGPRIISDIDDLNLDTAIGTEPVPMESGGSKILSKALKSKVAFIQFSSGSTGAPKGVTITRDNLVANIKAIISKARVDGSDTTVNWMPLTHDMGLVGFHLVPLFAGCNQIIIETSLFVRRPEIWLNKADQYGGTILSSPNFGFKHVLENVKIDEERMCDLSSVRLVLNGAEPVSYQLCKRFNAALSRWRLRDDVIMPVYGMAEATLAVTFPEISDPLRVFYLDRRAVSLGNKVLKSNKLDAMPCVEVGSAVDHCAVSIRKGGLKVQDFVIGEIHIKGSNVTPGYVSHGDVRFPGRNGWLNTGDIGFMNGAKLVVVGRSKEIIFVNGQNLFPNDIEESLVQSLNMEAGRIAVVGHFDRANESETTLVFVVSRSRLDKFMDQHDRIRTYLIKTFGITSLIIIPVRSIFKTTSGKIRRLTHLEFYLKGAYRDVLERLTRTRAQLRVSTHVAARDESESRLVRIWEEVLGRKDVGIGDNFFELGGHSLKVTRLSSRVSKEFNVKIELRELFSRPVLEDQAKLIRNAARESFVKIPVRELSSDYSLSSSQRRLWVLSQLEGGNAAYNMAGVYELEGDLSVEALEYAFVRLIERHEILRTVFIENSEGDVRQKVLDAGEVSFKVRALDYRGDESGEEKIKELISRDCGEAFDLRSGPLLRASVYRKSSDGWVFSYVMHHIISDGWSMGILIREVMDFYNGRVKGEEVEMEPLRIQYKDYAGWQQGELQGGGLEEHKRYWLEVFSGEIPVLDLPLDKDRPVIRTYRGGVVRSQIDGETTRRLRGILREEGSTLFMGLLAGVNVLLYKYTGQEDLIIGSPIAGRGHLDLEGQLGFYINMLPLRTSIRGTDNFREILERIREVTLGAYVHQDYPFDELVDALHLSHDMSRSALFDVMVSVEDSEVNDLKRLASFGELNVQVYPQMEEMFSKFDLHFDFLEKEGGIQISLRYNSDLFEKSTVERLGGHLIQLLERVVSRPGDPVGSLDYLSSEEKHQILEEFNNPVVFENSNKTLTELFEEQVQKNRSGLAVVYEDRQLTYLELNEEVNRLANYLKDRHGVEAGDLIGLKLERSEWMPVAILSVLKTGSAYVPIDPDYPPERIEYIRGDSACRMVLDEEVLKEYREVRDNYPNENLNTQCKPTDLAYVIYTSGSTGVPKGVMIEHRSIVNYALWFINEFRIMESHQSTLMLSEITFDLVLTSFYGALLSGKALHVVDRWMTLNGAEMVHYVRDHGISFLKITPQILKILLAEDQSVDVLAESDLKLILIGGEAIDRTDVAKVMQKCPQVVIVNHYGPTETTVGAIRKKIIHAHKGITIGSPIRNNQVFIVNGNIQAQPIGVVGEICIGGAGLARGYLNGPELTFAKFVLNPFHGEKALMYRTGDLGRWLPSGEIEFLGRKDNQVKVRGYRIELGEIESALGAHAAIGSSVVQLRPMAGGDKEIVAYYVPKYPVDISEIREYLGSRLPSYMHPTHYLELSAMPITPNGKIDRKKLDTLVLRPLPDNKRMGPRDESESRLVRIWEEVLGRKDVGIGDNFFELGGHSLKVTRLSSRVSKEFNVKIELRELFSRPVLEDQAKLIRNAARESFVKIPVRELSSDYSLSSSQRRLWVLSQLEGGNAAYNMAGVYELEGDLSVEALEYAFVRLIERHEILRTVFIENSEGDVRQKVLDAGEVSFKVRALDYRGDESGEEKIKELISRDCGEAFDLRSGPLLRASVYRKSSDGWVFSYVMHHIISDGWSMGILIREVMDFYNGRVKGEEVEMEPLRIQYKDYAGWQQGELQGGGLEEHKRYWLEVFSGEIPVLDLPLDKDRPVIRTYRGGVVRSQIDGETTRRLRGILREEGSTLFMGLLAGVNVLLYKYTGQEDIVLGTTIAGRKHHDLDDQLGFYVNMLALRSELNEGDTYRKVLRKTIEITLTAYDHQAYPFDELVGELKLNRDVRRHPLFDIVVELQHGRQDYHELNGLTLTPSIRSEIKSRFDLRFEFIELDDSVEIMVEYSRDIFNHDTVETMTTRLKNLFVSIARSADEPIDHLTYVSEREEHRILTEFSRQTARAFPYRPVVSLFESCVKQWPNAVAVEIGQEKITYSELNERSTFVARALTEKYGVRRGDLIGIMLERSDSMIVALMAVMKTGAAYVPVEPDHPRERKEYVMRDTGMEVLITDSQSIFELQYFNGRIFAIDAPSTSDQDSSPTRFAEDDPRFDETTYVIYTSGSTGTPKGCAITHGNLSNYIQWANDYYFSGLQKINFPLFTSLSFDLTVTSIFCPLTTGGKVIAFGHHDGLPDILSKSLTGFAGINCIKMTPAHVRMLGDSLITSSSMQIVVLGGEAVMQRDYDILKKIGGSIRIYNEYGPTEATVGCIVKSLDGISRIEIGRPILGTSIRILGKSASLCGIGVAGEICIAGAGVFSGYLNNPELTADKLIPDPFENGVLLYRTGDLGTWRENGSIECLGRMDRQVKIRGYRVELEEVERILSHYNGIKEVVVLARRRDDVAELIAYLSTADEISVKDIRSYANKHLPSYMVPEFYVAIQRMPLTPNGKVDHKALLKLEVSALKSGTRHVPARSEEEHHLCEVFQSVLRANEVGIGDDFFVLGGDSIKAIQVVSRMKERGYGLSIQDVLQFPILEDLAKRLKTAMRTLAKQEVVGQVLLGPVQNWFLHAAGNHKYHFNQSVLLQCDTTISLEALKKSLEKLTEHHDALRIVYRLVNGIWTQENLPVFRALCSVEEKGILSEEEYREACDEVQSSINLENGPLLKICLFRQKQGDRILIVAHHLIIDGVSWRILLGDLARVYVHIESNKKETLLLDKTDSFKDWQEHLSVYAGSKQLQNESHYWNEVDRSVGQAKLNGVTLEVNSASASDRRARSVSLDIVDTENLLTRCYRGYRTDVRDILVTGLSLGIWQTFGGEAYSIMMEGHGREHVGTDIDVSRTIGWFTSFYPVVIERKRDLSAQIVEVKETLHRVPNKGVGYGILRYIVGQDYRNEPLISFNYLGDFGHVGDDFAQHSSWRLSEAYRGKEWSDDSPVLCPLNLSAIIVKGTLRMTLDYDSKLFSPQNCKQLISGLQLGLSEVIQFLCSIEKEYLTPIDLSYKGLTSDEILKINDEGGLEDVCAMSPLQQGLYYHWLSSPTSGSYFEQMSYRLKGAVDVFLVEQSYRKLVSRHAVLRTYFTHAYGERPLQIIKRHVPADFVFISVSDFSDVEDRRSRDRSRGFDLQSGAQMRLTVLGSADEFEFIWSHHHILMDGWCSTILIKEFFEIYNASLHGLEAKLKPIARYSDYIAWLEQLDKVASLKYWKQYLAGFEVPTGLPKRATTSKPIEADEAEHKIEIAGPLRESIKNTCNSIGITESSFIQGVWGILLSRYNRTQDIVFGTVVSGRPPEIPGIEQMIGMFINTIPVRIRVDEARSVEQYLQNVQTTALLSATHAYVQLAEVQAESVLGRNLLDHILVFENFPVHEMLDQVAASADRFSIISSRFHSKTNFSLNILVALREKIIIEFKYDPQVYNPLEVESFATHLLRLLEDMINNPSGKLLDLTMIDDEESHLLVKEFNGDQVSHPKRNTINDTVEEWVRLTPEATAVVHNESRLSYRDLDKRSNLIAYSLWDKQGVRKGDLVGIMMERSEEMVVSMLGILKAGAAFVPIDPTYPKARKEFIFADTDIKVLITESQYIFDLDYFSGKIVAADLQFQEGDAYSVMTQSQTVDPSDLAYIIYTSGSSGQPKGVMIEHRGLLNTINFQRRTFRVKPGDHGLQFASISFDASVWEIFMCIAAGATLYLAGEEVKRSPRLLEKYIENNGISIATLPPVYAKWIEFANTPSLKTLITAGESAIAETARAFSDWGNFYNAYGPTESSVCATILAVGPKDLLNESNIAIGRPIDNTEIYILDRELRLLPVGVSGEIYIGGAGLMRGYLNNPEMTHSRLKANPFKPGEFLYASGDLGKWRADGTILYDGREDSQVKIRGYRVELGEIERVLLRNKSVTAAAVVLIGDSDDRKLVAFVVSASSASAEIKLFLKSQLPDYLIPSEFILLNSLPLTLSGKVDRPKLLTMANVETLKEDLIAPKTDTECKLVAIWEKIFEKTGIGIESSFFDLGGHSLKVMTLLLKVRQEFAVDIRVEDVFENVSIELLAKEIDRKKWAAEVKNVDIDHTSITL